jgi:hypothetical protein
MIVAKQRRAGKKYRQKRAIIQTVPAPIGGWDTRQAVSAMPPTNAVLLDNWFPETEKVTLRGGSAAHATGLGTSSEAVETLMGYNKLDGTNELFGACGAEIYDVTSAGAVGSAVVSSMNNARFQYVNMGTSGGQFLLAFNGADTPRTYNGSAWGTASMSGPTIANCIWCNTHHRRLWIGEEDSLSGWYGAANAITGTFTEFPFAGVFSKGGYIAGMGTWTRDSGEGSEDLAIFVTSEGQVAVYNGIDPSTAANWQLIGVFQIGRPIGRRFMLRAGADLILITTDGFVSLGAILALDRAQSEMGAISAQINDAVNTAVRLYGGNFGWEGILYSQGQQLIFNIPISGTEKHQYVFNTITQAPCRFTGLEAVTWGLIGDDVYLGMEDGTVDKYDGDNVYSDTGSVAISGDGVGAFNYFESMNMEKQFQAVEPIFESIGNPSVATDMNVDYQIRAATGTAAAGPTHVGIWGSSKWGVDLWGASPQVFRGWRGAVRKGFAGSLRVRIETTTTKPSWLATRYRFNPSRSS